MSTMLIWVVVGNGGSIRWYAKTRREARAEAKSRNEGPYSLKPYTVHRARVEWDDRRAK